ncbi:MAG: site-specific integrase [Chitinophagaceae bacterium]|nr:site-specific integrase [Chitinophagaceae bacterium]
MKPTTSIILDTRSKKKSGKYPVKIRVTYLRKQKYYPIWIDLTQEEFHSMENPGSLREKISLKDKKVLQSLKLSCNKELIKADAIIEKMNVFNHRQFEKLFYGVLKPEHSLIEYFEQEISTKKLVGKVGTASNYQSSLNSLKEFCYDLSFSDISSEFLRDYESWLLTNGKSITTVGIYLRPLRAILLKAINDGCFNVESYPFGKRKYQIPSGKNIKKALTPEEIRLIYNYQPNSNPWLQKAKDFFLFSYFACGMNMKDILKLKNENIDGDFIRFTRAKTQSTNRTGLKPISVPLTHDLLEIIDRWGGKKTNSDEEFIFPVLSKGLSPERERSIIQQFTKMVNRYIQIIAKDVGINKSVTTYFARHSYATIMRRIGATTEFISESLGHSSIKTTASYLDSFDDETRKKMHSLLTEFGK